MSKVQKIIELLGINKNQETAQRIIENMMKHIHDKKTYCENESLLFHLLGVDAVQDILTEPEVISLHEKIKYIIGMGSESLTESNRLYSYYFESKEATRDINKIDKKLYKWNAVPENNNPPEKIDKSQFKWDSLTERNDPMVSGDKKQKVAYYDSVNNTYLGQDVNQDLIMALLAQGILLMPDHMKKAERNIHKKDGSEMT
jgi:hypothetical protein